MTEDKSPAGPLARALAILDCVAAQQKSMTLADISQALGLPMPTVHRLVGHLVSLGYLQHAPTSKRIMVGPKLAEMSANCTTAAFCQSPMQTVLQKVSERLREQCGIGVVRNGYVAYIAHAKSPDFVGLQYEAGNRGPLHCTSTGKIYLSKLEDAELRKHIKHMELTQYTANTITDPEALYAEIRRVKGNGTAKTNQEFVNGVVGCAVPILSPGGALLACLGVSVPAARVPFEELDAFFPLMREGAEELGDLIANVRE